MKVSRNSCDQLPFILCTLRRIKRREAHSRLSVKIQNKLFEPLSKKSLTKLSLFLLFYRLRNNVFNLKVGTTNSPPPHPSLLRYLNTCIINQILKTAIIPQFYINPFFGLFKQYIIYKPCLKLTTSPSELIIPRTDPFTPRH